MSRSLKQSVINFTRKPVLATFLFGMSSGFPLTLVFTLMTYWLRDYGVSRTGIGLFALIGLAYNIKFIWSPILDGVQLGVFARRFGHRRSWLFLILSLMAGLMLLLAQFDPVADIQIVALIAALIGFLSASQDIIVDAYRIEIQQDEELGQGAAMYVYGYRVANMLAALSGLYLADLFGWSVALSIMPLFAFTGMIAAIWVGEPSQTEEQKEQRRNQTYKSFMINNVYEPFKDFLTRDNAILILVMIIFLKVGDAMADMMIGVFHIDLGFTKIEIADYSKLVGQIALFIGMAAGAVLYGAMGKYRALFIATVAMMVTNLIFIWAFYQGNDVIALAISMATEKFATGMGATVMVAYMSSLCNRNFTATQYALLSSAAGVGRTVMGSSGGFIVDAVGWVNFFWVTTVIAMPGVILLYILYRRSPETED
ncbi:MFS transporter [Temperatibacter marinus]|uniref:MFS transporter n=1 Tax=Temperatibacter marinus TaxID=1456591 RepID=A0AA52ELB7_9PROT|nr:MFS transporter [Temperatibacter marinus]WND04121.1 MFS transporter [Temperatibacter marinus]